MLSFEYYLQLTIIVVNNKITHNYTTVGYGNISPTTGIGRIVAVVLMLFGIDLIGMLTGAITTYFTTLHKKRKYY